MAKTPLTTEALLKAANMDLPIRTIRLRVPKRERMKSETFRAYPSQIERWKRAAKALEVNGRKMSYNNFLRAAADHVARHILKED